MREKGKDEGKVRGKGPTAEEGRAKGATGADTRGEVAGDSAARVIGQRRCGRAVEVGRQTVGARKQLSAGQGSSRCRRLGNGARKRWSEPMPGRRGWRSGGGEEAVVGTNSGAMKLWAALAVGSGLALSSTSRSLDALLSMVSPSLLSILPTRLRRMSRLTRQPIPCPRVSRRGDENANKGEDNQRLKAPHLDPLAEAVPDPRCGRGVSGACAGRATEQGPQILRAPKILIQIVANTWPKTLQKVNRSIFHRIPVQASALSRIAKVPMPQPLRLLSPVPSGLRFCFIANDRLIATPVFNFTIKNLLGY
uniref:Uncharacterized protein n=1 Tax=Oryza nivara TaxID=4536 RepID=A0A0E0FQC1_ORYNI